MQRPSEDAVWGPWGLQERWGQGATSTLRVPQGGLAGRMGRLGRKDVDASVRPGSLPAAAPLRLSLGPYHQPSSGSFCLYGSPALTGLEKTIPTSPIHRGARWKLDLHLFGDEQVYGRRGDVTHHQRGGFAPAGRPTWKTNRDQKQLESEAVVSLKAKG